MIDDPTAEAASLYVFDLLEPAEAQALVRRMDTEPELRALVHELMATAAALAHSAPVRPLTPALEARVLAAVRPKQQLVALPSPPARSRTVWPVWALAACLALGCLFLWSEFASQHVQLMALDSERHTLRDDLTASRTETFGVQTQLTAMNSEAATLRSDLAAMRSELAEVRAHDEMNELRIATLSSKVQNAPDASAIVLWDEQKQRGVIRTKKLPAPPADHDYQLWVIDADHAKPVDAGIFPGTEENVKFHPGTDVKAPKAFAVSLETKGGVPEAKGPIVLVGE